MSAPPSLFRCRVIPGWIKLILKGDHIEEIVVILARYFSPTLKTFFVLNPMQKLKNQLTNGGKTTRKMNILNLRCQQ